MHKSLLTGVHNDFDFHSQWDLRQVFILFVCLFVNKHNAEVIAKFLNANMLISLWRKGEKEEAQWDSQVTTWFVEMVRNSAIDNL